VPDAAAGAATASASPPTSSARYRCFLKGLTGMAGEARRG
jgi:hypothetical protein